MLTPGSASGVGLLSMRRLGMFKRASESLNHISRTASASTREQASGRIDAIPKWALEPEEYFQTLKARWNSLGEQRDKIQKRLSDLNFRLRNTLPHDEYIIIS